MFKKPWKCWTKHFYDNIFEKCAVAIINRPPRISEHSASLIDNILTTDIFNNSLEKGILKSNVSDHSPIFFSIQLTKEKLQESVLKIQKNVLSVTQSLSSFKEQLSLFHWRHIVFNGIEWYVNEIYDMFLRTMTDICNANFHIRGYIFKNKDIKSPWISKGLKKSSKKRQILQFNL